jgi:hypothetical protein
MHNDYWVAASAAAPLVGVAQVVNLSRYLAWNMAALEGRKAALAALSRVATVVEQDKSKILADLPNMDLSDKDAVVQRVLGQIRDSVNTEQLTTKNARVWSTNPFITRFMIGFSVLSGLLGAITTVVALASLGAERDEWSPAITTVLLSAAAGCFFVQGALEYLGRNRGLSPKESA